VNTRFPILSFYVFTDAKDDTPRCVNASQVQTFIPNPFGEGTLLTFASGDTVTLSEDFEEISHTLINDRADG
jgi:hypothetical protein